MAWAISAEVALGAKREAQRRNGGSEYHHDYHFKRPNVKFFHCFFLQILFNFFILDI